MFAREGTKAEGAAYRITSAGWQAGRRAREVVAVRTVSGVGARGKRKRRAGRGREMRWPAPAPAPRGKDGLSRPPFPFPPGIVGDGDERLPSNFLAFLTALTEWAVESNILGASWFGPPSEIVLSGLTGLRIAICCLWPRPICCHTRPQQKLGLSQCHLV